MSSGASVAYRLRPNKAVDRELFMSFLVRLAATLRIENYKYVGLGGSFLEEFRLLHARTGISDMICVERESEVHKRQKFNRPIATVQCVHNSLEDYLEATEFYSPVVLWLDYTDPKEMLGQIECFCSQVAKLPHYSIVRITLNANPSSLGSPGAGKPAANVLEENESTLHQWRLDTINERLADFVPNGMKASSLTRPLYGPALVKILQMALAKSLVGYSDRRVVPAFSTHYSDGQPMVTYTVVVVPDEDEKSVESVVKEWQFYREGAEPIQFDMPALSTRERLHLEASEDSKKCLEYCLPKSELTDDPLQNFKTLYRVFPHFATVDI